MSKPWSPFQYHKTEGRAPVVLVCEHASSCIPGDFPDLGLDAADAGSHAVWDIGALCLAETLSETLDAPLISGGVTRALYDCNRPFTAPDCIPQKSETIAFPGNAGLRGTERETRRRLIHDLFHEGARQLAENQSARLGAKVAVITVHSFTPVYFGTHREVEIGFLHHDDARLSQAACRIEQARGRYKTALNEPYGKDDGVTYSLARHADAEGRHATMIEVRNDLLLTDADAQAMGRHLASTLADALAEMNVKAGA